MWLTVLCFVGSYVFMYYLGFGQAIHSRPTVTGALAGVFLCVVIMFLNRNGDFFTEDQ